MVQWVDEEADHASEDGASNIDDAPQTFVVDLVSALRGYRQNPNEVFGHLVAAALASRSAQDPVTGAEMREAGGSVFLIRLMVDSGTLNTADPAVHTCVQDAVDALVPTKSKELNPALHEYLISFFALPFVRLSYDQYIRLKASGAEYVSLMLEYPHVLPAGYFLSITYLNCRALWIVNLLFLFLNLVVTCICVVAFIFVLGDWVTSSAETQSYGFYTLVLFGCGYALHLIALTYFVRYRQREDLYEAPAGVAAPSPFSAALPVLPLFDVMCVVSYFSALRKRKRIHAHNALACSRLGGLCYAMMYAVPQLFAQSYFNDAITDLPDAAQHRSFFTLLRGAVTAQFCVAVLRCAFQLLSYPSINGLGFARFNVTYERFAIDRHPAAAHLLHAVMFFVLEVNAYLVTASTLQQSTSGDACASLSLLLIGANAVSMILIVVTYVAIALARVSVTRVSFTCVPIVLLQGVSLAAGLAHYRKEDCSVFQERVLKDAFGFGYLCWGVYAGCVVLWLVWLCLWAAYRACRVNLFHQAGWLSASCRERLAARQRQGAAALCADIAARTVSSNSSSSSSGTTTESA
ncbi:hypothetical protein STCU_05558 [Strigomonas culicis]|uniref:Uncharacterized protein n=1 Tax=Strigomonas culicis TaxID=28005 RepID=S9VW83_9TRYP|nr:hypothetical protein STCU_05558 [Strigomonas culicis]|eukprot:EPY27780.1 hypothetical protein STCU_05558 [Strigomonas culicis]